MGLTAKDKKEIEKRLGFAPNKAFLIELLKRVEEGETIEQACSFYEMPDIIVLNDNEDPPPPRWPGQKRVIISGPNHKNKIR